MASIYKEDCKWYDYWQDMGARIPFCKAGKNMDASGFFLETCDECKDYGNKNVTTNADRIRAMTDEDLALFVDDVQKYNICCKALMADDCSDCMTDLCWRCWLDWLKQEVDDG